ncbi:BfmA/BtgA family mobilization protein [Leeuwenhoekiella aestuarii]|uniref:Uncharacterized protein n=1 Tax=Leeuwenhoekiella aestuarii TaxID=2249426 RepID=A0A4Q0NW87_9FLAO|nr:BfmA/BtgA family mobilization protein [Leeuwenhoekiella aestuarii]RXG16553.1 hypothetical protein DSM04_102126 [Leeuwenhoekiella aestuarii]
MTKKSILISAHYHKALKKLSETYNLSFYKMVEEMINYFSKTGIDPSKPKNESPTRALKELDKRLISFIKAQERDILKPIRSEVYNYTKQLHFQIKALESESSKKFIAIDESSKNRSNAVLKQISMLIALNEENVSKQSEILEELKYQRKVTTAIVLHLNEKSESTVFNKLKQIFE